MAYLLCASLFLIVLSARFSGRLFAITVILSSPILLAKVGSVLMRAFDLSVAGALLSAMLLLIVLIGGPYATLYMMEKRSGTTPQRDKARLRTLRNHLDG